MKWCQRVVCLLLCLSLRSFSNGPVLASDLQQEYVTTTPVVAGGVVYVASSTYPWHRGHLRAIDIFGILPVTLWDAAERVPLAGVGDNPGDQASSDPPDRIRRDNLYRSLFTNLAGASLPLTSLQAGALQTAMGVATTAEAELLLHAARGRRGGSPDRVAGSGEDPLRLWNVSRSSPVLVGRRPVNAAAAERDQMLYAGAEDGMLHGFFVSRWDTDSGSYQIDEAAGGTELWAYLPGSFLAYLKEQPLDNYVDELAVHLDGSPVVREVFLDLDGDGRRNWSTLLVATGTMLRSRRSCLFVINISDPYQPELLWEKRLPLEAAGRTRGVSVDRCDAALTTSNCIYLTADFAADFAAEEESAGIHALALTLETGQLLWTFSTPYATSGPVAEATPAVPVLMDLDGNGRSDALVFGDLVGQLWALDLAAGRAFSDAPVYQLPAGAAEPIGAGVAVQGNLAVFGTGGVEDADNNHQYAVYAVEIRRDGGRLHWTYPLAAGEKVWETPVIDAEGHLLFATAVDYLSPARSGEQATSGRIVALNRAGEEDLSRDTAAATVGRIAIAPGVAVSVALTGEVTQFGSVDRLTESADRPGPVRILSWRQQ
jgi:outer membrane protein assembly factor BamB